MLFVLIISVSTELNLDKKSRWLLGALSGAILISLISYYVNNSPIAISINICVVFIILRRLTNYKLSKIIIIYSYCLSIVYAIQIIIALGMKYYTDNFNTQFVYGVIAQMLALVVVVVLSRFQKLRTAYQMLDENFASRIIVINAFVIFYLFVMKWYMDFTGFIESTIIIVLIITILFAINGVLIKNVVEKQKFEEKMSVYDMYLPVIEEMIDEMRRKQHDYHNHLQALQGLLTQDGVNYRNNLVKNITWEKLIVLDNKVLMAFLFQNIL